MQFSGHGGNSGGPKVNASEKKFLRQFTGSIPNWLLEKGKQRSHELKGLINDWFIRHHRRLPKTSSKDVEDAPR